MGEGAEGGLPGTAPVGPQDPLACLVELEVLEVLCSRGGGNNHRVGLGSQDVYYSSTTPQRNLRELQAGRP